MSKDLLTKYGIRRVWSSVSLLNKDLFNNTSNDPYMWAENDADCLARDGKDLPLPYELVVAIGPSGTMIIQTLVFKDGNSHAKYIASGEVVFSEEGI